jgi:hypothetical protein
MEIVERYNHEYDAVSVFKRNPFDGYLEKLRAQCKQEAKPLSYVQEVVKTYFHMIGKENMPKTFYRGRYGYPKLAREAKELVEACGNNLEDALWCLDKMKYIANRKGFDWSIRTCLKYNLHSL